MYGPCSASPGRCGQRCTPRLQDSRRRWRGDPPAAARSGWEWSASSATKPATPPRKLAAVSRASRHRGRRESGRRRPHRVRGGVHHALPDTGQDRRTRRQRRTDVVFHTRDMPRRRLTARLRPTTRACRECDRETTATTTASPARDAPGRTVLGSHSITRVVPRGRGHHAPRGSSTLRRRPDRRGRRRGPPRLDAGPAQVWMPCSPLSPRAI